MNLTEEKPQYQSEEASPASGRDQGAGHAPAPSFADGFSSGLHLLTGRALFAHQVESVYRSLTGFRSSGGGVCNFSEMGTGKTLAAIATANYLASAGQVRKVLVVCPNTLKSNWKDEIIASSYKPWKIFILDGTSKDRVSQIKAIQKRAEPSVIIVNYESLLKVSTHLTVWGPDLIVADEAHKIKNHRAKQSKAMKSIPAKFKIAMTGTPVVQSVLDVWSIVDWVRPGLLFDNFFVFRARYADIYTGAGFPIIKKFKNVDELKARVESCSFRYVKAECVDLPPKAYQTIRLTMSKEEKAAYDDMAEELIVEVGDDVVTAQSVLTKMIKLQQVTSGFILSPDGRVLPVGGTKLNAIADLLESLEGKKVVVWCKFKAETAMLVALCSKVKRPYYVMTGDTKQSERGDIVSRFQSQSESLGAVFIGNAATGGVGITLNTASHCIYMSNSWSLADRVQSEDRLHRIGQKSSVSYYDMICSGTIDEYVKSVVSNKSEMSDKLTGDDVRRMIRGEANG